ncbi:hypothetical protein CBR_g34808 [Chara braunii]|uniref:Transcription factor CBF/NF-Y/archaeal histone domain-containing protein n=1 Tax=Chara braunii TaxID=69332 RepID=A0A388LJN8_CHABU|nr:hypothetical protein CBR_g34808 [Chara braunii]|eukprot:GBG82432.1 hypothetical protein CBR_g34808 [Chara braunii]
MTQVRFRLAADRSGSTTTNLRAGVELQSASCGLVTEELVCIGKHEEEAGHAIPRGSRPLPQFVSPRNAEGGKATWCQARIKKIMQADEDVGKIAQATPVLISKALELFLQDLCGKTYEIMAARGGRTIGINHLKACVMSNAVFDFLKDVVSRAPDVASEASTEDKSIGSTRRRVWDGQSDESGSDKDDVKRLRMDPSRDPVERQRGQGRGRGRPARARVHVPWAAITSREGPRVPEERCEERYGCRARRTQSEDSLNDGSLVDRVRLEQAPTHAAAVQRPVSSLLSGSGNGHSERGAVDTRSWGDGSAEGGGGGIVGAGRIVQQPRANSLTSGVFRTADGWGVDFTVHGQMGGVFSTRETLQPRFADNFYQGVLDHHVGVQKLLPNNCFVTSRGPTGEASAVVEALASGISTECIGGNFPTCRFADSPQQDAGGVASSNASPGSRVTERLIDDITTVTRAGDLSCVTSCGQEEGASLKRQPRDFDLNMDLMANADSALVSLANGGGEAIALGGGGPITVQVPVHDGEGGMKAWAEARQHDRDRDSMKVQRLNGWGSLCDSVAVEGLPGSLYRSRGGVIMDVGEEEEGEEEDYDNFDEDD